MFRKNLSENQRGLLRSIFPPLGKKLRVHDPFDILEAIFLIVYTGCQWNRLPLGYPPYKTVYYHYRSWSCRGYYSDLLRMLVQMRRKALGQSENPMMSVIDSHSSRTGLPQAVSGIDGGKKVKGIQRQLATGKNGFPLEIITTAANVHDVRGGEELVASLLDGWNDITLVKGDLGYRGMFKECPLSEMGVPLECVKSNFGTAGFRPIQGRWVVVRTFSWLQNYRRMMRNYEQHLHTARAMVHPDAEVMSIGGEKDFPDRCFGVKLPFARLRTVLLACLSGHDARIAPSETRQNHSPGAAPASLKFYESGP